MRRIRLMADYFCYPLWDHDDYSGDIDPATLPISQELQNRLISWKLVFDSILNLADPASSEFKSKDEEKKFISDGYYLAKDLKSELGEQFTIIYQPTHDTDYPESQKQEILVYI